MQSTPFRLSQALWTAFRAAKPIHRQVPFQSQRIVPTGAIHLKWPKQIPQAAAKDYRRSYSSSAKDPEIDKKAEIAKQRIEDSLDSRANIAQNAEPTVKAANDETIVHTIPESSSIVHARETNSTPAQDAPPPPPPIDEPRTDPEQSSSNNNKYAEWAASRWQNSPLPSQIASLRSRATKRFSYFMDNLQGNIVVAAHHLNDLTGYTGIERLKKEIEDQETAVQNARQHVKDSRDKYSEAISMRSTTQREVNDLLHRKHAWSPTDLERFTTLYRSDHANEQAEQKTHQQVSEAEAQYEEASTRLAKSILARYHEEQIWSDKIRQMSTWGTWGLMGLNVLLFIVFQIMIEPWRRRRLVKGFEEKVQAALDDKERLTDEKLAILRAERNGDQVVAEAVEKQPVGLVATAAEEVAAAIADAVTGTTTAESEQQAQSPTSDEIESAAEQVTMQELEAEDQSLVTSTNTDAGEGINSSESSTTPSDNSTIEIHIPILESETPPTPQTWQEQVAASYHHAVKTSTNTFAHYSNTFIQQFNDKEHVVLSKREMTTKILEGVVAGVAVTCSIVFVFVRSR